MKTFIALALVVGIAGWAAAALCAVKIDSPSGAYAHFISEEVGTVKVPGLVPALKFTAKDFADLGPPVGMEGGKFSADAVEVLFPKGVSVDIKRLASAEEVQKVLKDRLEHQSSGIYVRVLKGPMAEVGDICTFTLPTWNEKKDEEQLSKEQLSANYVWFSRNNVQVKLQRHQPDAAVDLVALAKRIDKQILSWVEAPMDAPPKAAASAPAAAPAN